MQEKMSLPCEWDRWTFSGQSQRAELSTHPASELLDKVAGERIRRERKEGKRECQIK